MDHPAKRLKISRSDSRSPRDAGSRMKEGLFTSELGTRSDETDGLQFQIPTRTISLSDMQRGKHLDIPRPRPQFVRRNAALQLLPRVPDATVTASVVDINVDVGSTTLEATEIAAATSEVLVSVSSLGTLTIPAVDSSAATDTSASTASLLDSSQSILTSTPPSTPLPTDSSASSTSSDPLAPTSSLLLTSSINGTSTETTVTVTATSTLEISYNNGTFVLPSTLASSLTSMSMSITGQQSTLVTNTRSGEQSSGTAVFGSTGPDTTNFQSVASPIASTEYGFASSTPGTTSTGSAASASSSSSSGGGGSSGTGLTPTQQQVVGGVVGGVAGVAVVLLVALVFLRWYRRRLKSQGRLPEQQTGATRDISTSGGDSFAPMSERSSNVPLAAAMASFGRRLRSHSSNTFATTATGATNTTVPESERGFQRIAGRKIGPVIGSGVDQYGGNYGAFEKDIAGTAPTTSRQRSERELAGTSFYRDSGGFYGGKGPTSSTPSPAPTTPSAPTHSRNISNTRDFAADSPNISASKPEGFAVLRPSPARTPTTRSPSSSSIKLPIQQAPTLEPEAPPTPALPAHLAAQRDAIGRSLASQDGSRVSRASKGSGSRFSERI